MEKPMRVYVALGDSFSSGEGDAPFEDGTDVPYSGILADYNLCHRSTTAYARLLAGDKALRLDLGRTGFRACSGATSIRLTDNWPEKNLDGSPGPNTKEGAQKQALDPSVKVVTITIGGNDAGFSDFVGRCVLADCSSNATRQEFLGKNGRVTLLNATLTGAYEEILRDAPNATVYVKGYPQLLPASDCSKPGMGLLNTAVQALASASGSAKLPVATRAKTIQKWLAEQNGIHLTLDEATSLVLKPSISFTKSEQTIAKDLVTDLDLKIQTVVQQVDAGRGRLVYVDPRGKTSPFIGHELCTTTPYFNGLTVNPSNPAHDLSYSFHPNKLGQSAYAQLLRPFLVPTS
jgi:lysophospholipase L1-like esterase